MLAKPIVGEKFPPLAREPILLRNRSSVQGLILTQTSPQGLSYRYHLIEEFQQDATGKCAGRLSRSTTDDYLQQFDALENRWWEKRELLEKFKRHPKPTALISIVGALTLSDELARSANRQAEVPDLILYARPGQRFDAPTKRRLFARPVFNYYLTPFVLDATGRERNPVFSERIPRFSLEDAE